MEQFHIQNLTFSYPGSRRRILEDISLTVHKGDYILVCGESGSGKTTLMRHLKPPLMPYGTRSGEIFFNGQPLSKLNSREQAAQIGFVMQNPDDQIVTDKVWHELAFGLENLGCDRNTMRLRVAEMASYFGILNWFHREVSELSGGQKQLLNLASIMAMQPEVLILDEPTSQLDPIAAADFLNTLSRINRELGTTILITEHRLEDVFPRADRVVVMEAGRVIADAAPKAVGETLFRTGSSLISGLPVAMRIFYGDGGSGSAPITVREGRNWLQDQFPQGAPAVSSLPEEQNGEEAFEPVLQLKDLWFRYDRNGQDILKGLNYAVPKGQICAVLGGNGAGKSTMLKAICGICRTYRGKTEIFGKELKRYSSKELFHDCVSMLPQDPQSLFVKNTVEEELKEMTADSHRIQKITKLCEIDSLLEAHPRDLSGGEQQRVALAKVLLTDPRLLLLDEPTKGMDSAFKQRFAHILSSLKASGVTVIMVSHDVEFCAEYADRVSLFFDGQILTTDTTRRFFGANSFYTTTANRMSRSLFRNAVTAGDVISLLRRNREAEV